MRIRRFISFVVVILMTLFERNVLAAQSITLDGSVEGRTFEGIGGASAGASSRLLIDYPEPYRSQILDYLFKPNYGAGFQHLKVEVGGDVNSTDGVEPSHMHTATDENYNRGYEWFLMTEAKARNPNMILDCLEWGAPGWIGKGTFFSQDNANYLVKFINGAKTVHGLTMDWVGIRNEVPYDTSYIKLLRSTLDDAGLTSVNVVAADQTAQYNWNIVDSANADTDLNAAIAAAGQHYPGTNSTPAAQAWGKPLWSSEDGPWNGTWSGAQSLAKTYNRNYINGLITKTEIWSPISSYYDNLIIPGSGVMYANTPWSGYYEVQPAVWATAHTTQFAAPGWKYLGGSGVGFLTTAGSYVTLKAPNGTDYSIVIETIDTGSSQTVTFNLTGGLSTATVHVWQTNSSSSFVPLSDITPQGGSFTITLDGDSIYSLTTTTGQTKGSATPPPAAPFPLPYTDDFDCDTVGVAPKFFSDEGGVFEVANRTVGTGQCLRQVMTQLPIGWHSQEPDPITILGSTDWTDYEVSSDVYIESSGYVAIYGRIGGSDGNGIPSGYGLKVDQAGNWALITKDASTSPIDSGMTTFSANAWHNLKLKFEGNTLTGYVDGTQVTQKNDGSYGSGLAGLGSGWNGAQFDNYVIQTPSWDGGEFDAGGVLGGNCTLTISDGGAGDGSAGDARESSGGSSGGGGTTGGGTAMSMAGNDGGAGTGGADATLTGEAGTSGAGGEAGQNNSTGCACNTGGRDGDGSLGCAWLFLAALGIRTRRRLSPNWKTSASSWKFGLQRRPERRIIESGW